MEGINQPHKLSLTDLEQLPPIYAIVGPTASGKTAYSFALAQALGGSEKVEIISADSMQLYKGMDIGTAKVSSAQRAEIIHHQIDVLEVQEEASAAAYQKYSRMNVYDIFSRGKIPIIVGGSGLYVSALLDKLEFPGRDEAIQAQLNQLYNEAGLAPLVKQLTQLDPVTAQVIDLQNPRRVIRALEVNLVTGKSFTPIFPRYTSYFPRVKIIGIDFAKEALHGRIYQRAEQMFANGLLEETQYLLGKGLENSPTAGKATGYAQAIKVLKREMTIAEAVEETAFLTRRLAKKQFTWFRADKRITWFDFTNGIPNISDLVP